MRLLLNLLGRTNARWNNAASPSDETTNSKRNSRNGGSQKLEITTLQGPTNRFPKLLNYNVRKKVFQQDFREIFL